MKKQMEELEKLAAKINELKGMALTSFDNDKRVFNIGHVKVYFSFKWALLAKNTDSHGAIQNLTPWLTYEEIEGEMLGEIKSLQRKK